MLLDATQLSPESHSSRTPRPAHSEVEAAEVGYLDTPDRPELPEEVGVVESKKKRKKKAKAAQPEPAPVAGTTEADELMVRIEGIESQLQLVEQTMSRYKLSYKAAKETRDDLLEQMREVAKTRLEVNPLFDGGE
jgi:hypothetical protein